MSVAGTLDVAGEIYNNYSITVSGTLKASAIQSDDKSIRYITLEKGRVEVSGNVNNNVFVMKNSDDYVLIGGNYTVSTASSTAYYENGTLEVKGDIDSLALKASKNHKLTYEEKCFNRSLAKRRIFIEHINRYIKRFKILSSRYRNKRRRLALRTSLICGIYNFQHNL